MGILVLGTVALDNVKTPFGSRRDILGGSAAHFSMSARLFTNTEIVAVVGKDFPEKYINFLRAKHINLNALVRGSGKTFEWSGEYKGDLNTAYTLHTELGVLSGFKPVVSEAQKRAKHAFLANVDPHIQRFFLGQLRSPKLVGVDTMNFWILKERSALLRLLKKVDIFVANDQEARSLSSEHNLIKAAKRLRSFGPRIVVIKKGEHGVLFYCDRFIFCLPAYPKEKVIDPTGAGDTFAGGFMGYLSRMGKITDNALKKAVCYGTIAASFNVEGFGLERTARLTLKDIEKRLADFRKFTLF